MSPFIVRLGAVAGWLGLVGVIGGLIVIPAVIAGQPPSSTSDLSAIRAYFGHAQLAVQFGLVNGYIAVAFVTFGLGLRAAIRSGADSRSRALADIGLGLVVVTIPLYLASGALGATLVDVAGRGGTELATIFRLYDVTYDGLADVLEGAWIGAFSLALLNGTLPRWIGWLGVVVGVSRWIKAFGPFVAMPDLVPTIGGLLFLVWFVAIVAALTRIAMRSTVLEPRSPAQAMA
jgi:hypothetical protein